MVLEVKEKDEGMGEKGENGLDNSHFNNEKKIEKDMDIPEDVNKDSKDKSKEDEKEDKNAEPPVGLIELFKFATKLDVFLIVFGLTIAFFSGGAMPIMTIFFGDTLQAMIEDRTQAAIAAANGTEYDSSEFMAVIERFGWGMTVLAAVLWIVSYIFVTALNYAAAKQVFRIRGDFLKSVLKQDIGWYDVNTSTDFASRMTEDLNKLQEGIGEKLGMMSFFTGTFVLSMITAFVYGWQLTLVLLCMMPIMAIAGGLSSLAVTKLSSQEMSAYANAGAVAEEALAAIKTVLAFGGADKEIDRYSTNLKDAEKKGIQRSAATAFMGGSTFGIMYCVYGLGFWYGIKLIMDDRESEECLKCELDPDCLDDCLRYNGRNLLVVFFSVLMGGFQLAQCAPYAEALSTARGAAAKIYKVIDTQPAIDSSDPSGDKPKISGNMELSNVVFNYPSRKDVKILQGLSLNIPEGKTVALVGSSGCGKSTVIQLVQRFYDPDSGSVRIDGHDIMNMNVGWLRDHIGIVGQEPVLFDCTIIENIRLGKADCTIEQATQACKAANAWDFIQKLPKQMDTMVGEGGTQLSGGQKQRIAIARALVRNPRILLLDEATSALDSESEKVVQAALDAARTGRTTIVVAHRLSTVRNADMIVAINKGEVEEKGTHEDLMELKGLYYSLVTRQMGEKVEEKNAEDEDEEEKDNDEKRPTLQRQGSVVKKLQRQLSTKFNKQKSVMEDDLEMTKAEDDDGAPKVAMGRLLKENKPEWLWILIGVIASCGMGALMPIFAILFGDVLGVISYTDTEKARDESVFYAIMFCLLGLGTTVVNFLQGFMFGLSGERMTARLRKKTFSAMLAQEMGWYDLPENNTGALCARLSGDAAKIQGATGVRVGSIVQGVAGLLIACIMGLYFNWKLGLVCIVFFPLLIGATYAQMKIIQGVDSIESKAFEVSSKLAIEAITNIRTVAGLQCEARYVAEYIRLLEKPHKISLRKSHYRGHIFGFSQAITFFAYGITMYYGGVLIRDGEMIFEDVFKVQNAVIGGASMIGYSFAFTGDMNNAFVAAARVFNLLDRVPKIDTRDSVGLRLGAVQGNASFLDAVFSYPTRKKIQVLNKLRLAIKAGESVALVGESGCGKSTVIQLIQRFYDLDAGDIKIETESMQALNVPFVRSKMGIVSQEPVLFDRTIAENIQYGDNSRDVSMEEVIDAARKANIHSFVAALPEGYNTRVGGKGTQLSGGQKQRVAIARALVRNPRILLLDEATSALDTESEKVVQEALDAAQAGRTSITIAHRLSTIKAVDKIFVIEAGQVSEAGTHAELLAAGGKYSQLWANSVR